MRVASLLLLSIVGLLLVSLTVAAKDGIGPEKCCYTYFDHPVAISKIRSYSYTDPRCPKAAVLLTTTANRQVCLDPEVPRVKKFINRLNDRDNSDLCG